MKKMFAAFAVAAMFFTVSATPTPDEALSLLKAGNARMVKGEMSHPNSDADRRQLASKSDQGKYAYATILSCADSRVPVEYIFDAGVMDLFVVRVAGNVADTDEVGTIEYGVAHVNTPVVVVLGHTGCGAVKAVTAAVQGHGHPLEINIPPLVDNVGPAVAKAIKEHKDAVGEAVVPFAIEENIWQGISDLFMKSPVVRRLVAEEKLKVVGAQYDIGSGAVTWLPEAKVADILKTANANPKRQTQEMAGGSEEHEKAAPAKEHH